MSTYTEDHLVEQPAVQLMQHGLGWDVVNCWDEWSGGTSALGRDGKREVVLTSRLKPTLIRLNPDLPMEAIEGAVEEEILNGRGRRVKSLPSDSLDFQCFRPFQRAVKSGVLLKLNRISCDWLFHESMKAMKT